MLRSFAATTVLVAVCGSGVPTSQSAIVTQSQPEPSVVAIAGKLAAGFDDGPGGADGTATFNRPYGLSYDQIGNLYVSDIDNHAIRKVDVEGNVTTVAGNGTPGFADGTGGRSGTARFNKPLGVGIDQAGNICVGDAGNHAIRKIDADGNVTTVGTKPDALSVTATTPSEVPMFRSPGKIVFDSKGNLFVNDSGSILKMDSTGKWTEAGFGQSLAVDPAGSVYTIDGYGLERTFLVRKHNSKGGTAALWDFRMGAPRTADGRYESFRAFDLTTLAADRNGNIFVTDLLSFRKIAPNGEAFNAGFPPRLTDDRLIGNSLSLAIGPTNGLTLTMGNTIIRFDNPPNTPLPPDQVDYGSVPGKPKPTVPSTTAPKPITIPKVPRVCRIGDELNVPPRSKTTSFSSHLQDQTILLLKLLKSLQRELPQAIKRDWATLIREEANLLNGVSKLNRQKLAQPIRDELAYDLVFRHSERLKSEPFVKRLNEWFRTTCKAFGEDSLPI
jgi:NHL repeat